MHVVIDPETVLNVLLNVAFRFYFDDTDQGTEVCALYFFLSGFKIITDLMLAF